ncbi:MAG TPA: hypothetical protein VGB73_11350 [Pyrinomonadaceae bacterium]|jgi:hypothetical protein
MTAQTLILQRFRRKTTLAENEYNTKFHMLDNDIAEVVSSPEADMVTPLMSKIYLRLLQTPTEMREGDRVLRFEGETLEGKWVKAWDQLCKHLRVSSETANKALRWMHEQGVIGYSAFKNGVGIRIFLNRAASSIASRVAVKPQKILRFPPASAAERPASLSEAAFKDSFADSEVSDSDLNPRAPKNGADKKSVGKKVLDPPARPDTRPSPPNCEEGREVESTSRRPGAASMDDIVERLKRELEPCVKAAATQAAAQTATREIARTREWFETKALPKAVRVAQHETYDLLRKHGAIDERGRRARANLEVGCPASDSYTPSAVRRLSPEEVRETAEICVALLETQGKSIDVTLSEISSEGGGWLLPEDAPRVREAALALLRERSERR